MSSGERPQVLEVEVERLPEHGSAEPARGQGAAQAPAAPLNPVVAGLVIDALDFATRGPRGFLVGGPLGGVVGYWLGRRMGLDRARSAGLGGVCALYCSLPGTELLPLGTLVGIYRLTSR